MNQLVPIATYGSPALVAAGDRAQKRFIEFFTYHTLIRGR